MGTRVTTRKIKLAVATGVAVALTSVGATLVIAEIVSPSPTTSTTTAPPGPTGAAPNPEAGMTDAQRQAFHDQQWASFDQQYRAWIGSLKVDQFDLHSLPRNTLTGDWAPGQSTLHDAVAHADLIVVGTVSAIQPTPYSGTVTTMAVGQTLKGSPVSSVQVTQQGGLRPTLNWTGTSIAEAANGALLLPGDRAVLLLQKTSLGYEIQSASGWYEIVGGAVQVNSLNTFGASVVGGVTAW